MQECKIRVLGGRGGLCNGYYFTFHAESVLLDLRFSQPYC